MTAFENITIVNGHAEETTIKITTAADCQSAIDAYDNQIAQANASIDALNVSKQYYVDLLALINGDTP